jgi:alpha-L-fucosidase 2
MTSTARSLLRPAFTLALAALIACPATMSAADDLKLWYRRPAAQWVEALPVGNGRLGAMVFGGVEQERIQLNEDTLWSGGPYNPANPQAAAALPEIRRLLAAGENQAAQTLVSQKFMSIPLGQSAYQTVGDLMITMAGGDGLRNYRRELDLDTSVARTEFQLGNSRHTREVFVSVPDQVVVAQLTGNNLTLTLGFQSQQRSSVRVEDGNTLVLSGINGDFGNIKGALKFEARAVVTVTGGQLVADAGQLHVNRASAVTITIAAATSYRRYDDVSGDPTALTTQTLTAVKGKPYAELRERAVAEHQKMFRRVALNLGRDEAAEKLPTDERVRQSPTTEDPSLATLYFQYGRYLLLGSSRPGGQPANLQGLWNDNLSPPWGSKYTININTEMNYWPAESTNLSETTEPLLMLVKDLSETGAKLAREHYGTNRGWVAHHNTDLWRATGPIDGAQFGTWPTGGAWLSVHLWEHFLYTGDRAWLTKAYPLMKGAAEFFLDNLQEEKSHGWLVTSPSMSPENNHHRGIALAQGPTMDNGILRDLFNACIASARILNTDADFAAKVKAARDRLPPYQIGKQGQLQEWLDDWDSVAPEQRHRHVSHLYAFYPSNQITLRGTPELAAAVKQTLETRGDISTGWAIAWRLNLWARQQDAERTHKILSALLAPERTYPNLFDAHPPFQIDGNFGGTAAIAEMLLQSHVPLAPERLQPSGAPAFEIELLPALPKAWATGSVTGLRARGGFEVDLAWRDGRLTNATLRGPTGAIARLRYGNSTRDVTVDATGALTWDGR